MSNRSSSAAIPIVRIPHPALRVKATKISLESQSPQELSLFANSLATTLLQTRKPKGVGLAAPQIAKSWRVFATNLADQQRPNGTCSTQLTIYINPEIVDQSKSTTLGPDQDSPILEGCLSIPGLWGPVPRREWVLLKWQELNEDGNLIAKQKKFTEFAARVVQHELDHLDGILFIDYSWQSHLPLYQEAKHDKLEPLTEDFVATIYHSSLVKSG